MFGLDWQGMFVPDVPFLEIFIRGTIIYLSAFLLLRFVLKREAGTISMTDLLVITLLADAAQNAMSSNYHSITDGILLVMTILFWSFVLDWLSFRFPLFRRITYPPPLELVNNGIILYRNLRKEYITEDELMSMIRQEGIEDLSQVKKAFLEANGKISVVTH